MKVILVLLFIQYCHTVSISTVEGRLQDFLFKHKGYNKLIRPVPHLNDTLTVRLGLGLIQIISVDEKNQIVVTNVWLRFEWTDFQLQWDPRDFQKVSVMRVPSNKIWRPDIVLFNNADGNYEVSWQPNVVVSNDGNILWIPPTIFKSSCDIDVTYFPFDQQMCQMRFGSWTFNAKQVALGWYDNKKYVELENYWKSETWEIVSSPGKMINFTSNSDNLPPRTEIVYYIHIRRKTLYYTVNLIIPCVIIAFLTSTVFYLPADAGEKITLSISVLLALVVFLLLVSKLLPPTSVSVPLISKYLLFTFVLNIIVIFITVAIININYRTPRTHQMPKWIKMFFMVLLPPILFMNRPAHINEEILKKKMDLESRNVILNQIDATQYLSSDSFDESLNEEERKLESDLSNDLDKIINAINYIASCMQDEDNTDRALHDWKYVASVIDRLMLIIFNIITVLGTFGILTDVEKIEGNSKYNVL